MIRVTVELVSAVDPGRSRVLGVAEIANVGGSQERGDYSVTLAGAGKSHSVDETLDASSKWAPMTGQAWKRGTVRGFDRVKRGAWDLLFLALRDCVGSRNPEHGR